jgi:hypothetical protein
MRLLLLFTLALLPGCVAWHGGTAVDTPLTKTTQRSKLALEVTYAVPEHQPISEAMRTKAIDAIAGFGRETLEEGDFLLTPREEADYVLKVDVALGENNGSAAWCFISGVTLTVLPCVAVDRFSVRAELDSKDGKALASKSFEETRTTFVQLLMLFGLPFATPSHADRVLWRDVFSELAALGNDRIKRAGQ